MPIVWPNVASPWLVKVGVVASAFFLAGKLALLIAIPPGYATAVWPPAGIALVCVLLFGYRVWPGVLLGSFLVNVGTSYDASGALAIAQSLSIPASIGVGAALQAIAGAFLVRRFVGYPNSLDRGEDIAAFLTLGGAISCLVAPTCGVTTLVIAGIVPETSYGFNWFTWWVGDTIGVIVFAPLSLVLLGEPHEVWRRRRYSIGLPLAIGFGVVTLLFVRVSAWEQARLDNAFTDITSGLAYQLERRLDQYLEVVASITGLYHASDHVSRSEFRRFVEAPLARYPGITALSWVPRVVDLDRSRYVQAARQDGYLDYEITVQSPDGAMTRSPVRSEYFPVYYLEPYTSNERALGFDIASEPLRLETLRKCAEAGASRATPPITLVQDTGAASSILVFAPVYAQSRADQAADRGANLSGIVSAVFRADRIIATALRGSSRDGIILRLVDQTDPGNPRLLYSDPRESTVQARAANNWNTSFDVAGRLWRLEFTPTATFLAAQRSWQAWIVLAGGLSLVGILGALLMIVTGREARVARAETKYRDLYDNAPDMHASVNATAPLGYLVKPFKAPELACAIEIALNKHHIDARLRERERWLASTLRSIGDAVVATDADYRVKFLNPVAEALTGWRREEAIGRALDQILSLVVGNSRRPIESPVRQALREKAPSSLPSDAALVARSGAVIPICDSAAPILDDSSNVLGGVMVFRKATEQRQTEEEISKLNAEIEGDVLERIEQLEAANKELEAFSSSVAHDLRAPLRGIHVFSQALIEKHAANLGPEGLDNLRRIRGAARNMGQLIEDLLRLAQVAKADFRRQTVNLSKLVQAVEAELQLADRSREVDFVVRNDIVVEGDKRLLKIMVENLLRNSWKFTSKTPKARIEFGHIEKDGVGVSFVRDNGVGFDMQCAQKLFGAFQRFHSLSEFEGTGLGLATVHRIITRHGGRIWAESIVGQGATFYFIV